MYTLDVPFQPLMRVRIAFEQGAGFVGFLLWILAVILVIAGIVTLFQGQLILGIVLIVVGLAVGPGGWSVLKK